MPDQVDRGRLVVEEHDDGTTSLSICSMIVDGTAADVFASYRHLEQVTIEEALDARLVPEGRIRYTKDIVEVADLGDAGIVVRYPTPSAGSG